MLAFAVGLWNIYSTHHVDRFKEKYLSHFMARPDQAVQPKGWTGWVAAVVGFPARYRALSFSLFLSLFLSLVCLSSQLTMLVSTVAGGVFLKYVVISTGV